MWPRSLSSRCSSPQSLGMCGKSTVCMQKILLLVLVGPARPTQGPRGCLGSASGLEEAAPPKRCCAEAYFRAWCGEAKKSLSDQRTPPSQTKILQPPRPWFLLPARRSPRSAAIGTSTKGPLHMESPPRGRRWEFPSTSVTPAGRVLDQVSFQTADLEMNVVFTTMSAIRFCKNSFFDLQECTCCRPQEPW